jgi:hypothetical protein
MTHSVAYLCYSIICLEATNSAYGRVCKRSNTNEGMHHFTLDWVHTTGNILLDFSQFKNIWVELDKLYIPF